MLEAEKKETYNAWHKIKAETDHSDFKRLREAKMRGDWHFFDTVDNAWPNPSTDAIAANEEQ